MVQMPNVVTKPLDWITANEADLKKTPGLVEKLVNNIIKILTGEQVEPEKLKGFDRAKTIATRLFGVGAAVVGTGAVVWGAGKGLEYAFPALQTCQDILVQGDESVEKMCKTTPSIGENVTKAGKLIAQLPFIPPVATWLGGKAIVESEAATAALGLLQTFGSGIANVVNESSKVIDGGVDRVLTLAGIRA